MPVEPLAAGAATAAHVLAVRHGLSEWNAAGRWQGQADSPLAPEGEAQAVAAAEVLAVECPPFDGVLASDLSRARRTAELMAAVLGVELLGVDRDLRETRAGEWEGLTREQIDEQWPGWLDGGRRPPAFEPYDDAGARFLGALRRHANVAGSHLLVVSHSGVIRAARRLVGGADHRFPNLGGAWFEVATAPGTDVRPGAVVLPLELRARGDVE